MASIASVTKQIAALDISSKKPTNPRSGHTKQPSQTNVAKLLTKYAAPNPPSKPPPPSTLRHQTTSDKPETLPPKAVRKLPVDIGKYDGGFEIDNEKRGEKVYGEAAEDLALDSSTSR